MMQDQTFLQYRDHRFLKIAALLAAAAILAYGAGQPSGGEAYGGTGLGYALGVASSLIVLLLTWYGIRRRRPSRMPERRRSERRKRMDDAADCRRKSQRRRTRAEDDWRYGGSLQGWLSAHVYLGFLLVVLASLHAGFSFGWNMHTLPYALVVVVFISGCYGAFAYLHYPRLIAENLGEDTIAALARRISELDELARFHALALPEDINALVKVARHGTRLDGGGFRWLFGRRHVCATDLVVRRLQERGKELVDGDQPGRVREVYSLLLQKQRLLERFRTAMSLDARLRLWRHAHAPLSVALLAALLVHVVAVFFYW